jgi:hypothetical protein
MHVFWIGLVGTNYRLMHCTLSLSCAWSAGKKLQTHNAQVSLINDDSGIAFELFLFAINIKKEICDVWNHYFL